MGINPASTYSKLSGFSLDNFVKKWVITNFPKRTHKNYYVNTEVEFTNFLGSRVYLGFLKS
jgi:hypothetical protein